MTLRRVTRNRLLSPEEAAKYREIREQVAQELPELIARHEERLGWWSLWQTHDGQRVRQPSLNGRRA
jgi:hypothetical protein